MKIVLRRNIIDKDMLEIFSLDIKGNRKWLLAVAHIDNFDAEFCNVLSIEDQINCVLSLEGMYDLE